MTITPNVKTHTGQVHKAHTKKLRGERVPACMTINQILSLHFAYETAEAITCTKPKCRA